MDEREAREAVRAAGVKLVEEGLVAGTWGNVSVKFSPTEMAITPSGFDYLSMRAEDVVIVDLITGEARGGKPSTEKKLHAEIYRTRPEVRAVIHTHSMSASTVAAARREVPPILDDLAQIVGPTLRVADYAIPGSPGWAVRSCARCAVGWPPSWQTMAPLRWAGPWTKRSCARESWRKDVGRSSRRSSWAVQRGSTSSRPQSCTRCTCANTPDRAGRPRMSDVVHVIAYDVGTTGAKACLYAIGKEAKLVAGASADIPLSLLPNGGVEQDPVDWWKAVCADTRKLLADSGLSRDGIKGIAFCCQMQGPRPR